MKKKTKDWLKEKLINYLEENNVTIDTGRYTMHYKIGIVERPYYYKEHSSEKLEEYLEQIITQDYDSSKFYNFLEYLITQENSKDYLIDLIKAKSPTNSTQIEKDGEIKKINTSNDLWEYRRKVIPLIQHDDDLLFDYVGNLKFLYAEYDLVFELINSNNFSKEKEKTLIEMYANSAIMKRKEFERVFYNFLEKRGEIEEYKHLFPNLSEGKKEINLMDFNPQEMGAYIISIDQETAIKLMEADKTISSVSNNIENIVNLEKIEELGIDSIVVKEIRGSKKQTVIFLGDNINKKYLEIAIKEYMNLIFTEKEGNIKDFINANKDFEKEEDWLSAKYKVAFTEFKERINKIYLYEKMNENLTENNKKTKSLKI